MKQMPNSKSNAQLIPSAPTCHNTMLSASALSAEQVSILCKDFLLDCQKTDETIHIQLNSDRSIMLPNRILTVTDLEFLNLINRRFIDTDKKPIVKITYKT